MLLTTPTPTLNTPAPPFTLPDLNGEPVSLAQSVGENGILIAFICNHCPYVQAIITRLVQDATALQKHGIPTLAIMPNDYTTHPQDHPDQMKTFAAQHNFPFPYLLDETQQTAKAYDAICTPDFFGYNRDLKLQYRGRLDDAKMTDPTNRTPELLNALTQIAKTQTGPQTQHPSMGCSIKWKT